MATFREQVQRNMVALISLVVAITSLAYNTIRNEVTETNRNVRAAGMEIIQELAGLQQVALFARFRSADFRGDSRVGWGHVLAIKDYAALMPDEVMTAADALADSWNDNFEALEQEAPYDAVDQQIDTMKDATLMALAELD